GGQRVALIGELVDARRLRERALFRKREIAVDVLIVGRNLLVKLFHHRRSCKLPLFNGGAGGCDGEQVDVHRSITFGTLKKFSSLSGAFESASSCGNDGRIS